MLKSDKPGRTGLILRTLGLVWRVSRLWTVLLGLLTLKMLSWVGIVWDLRTPPQHILEGKPAGAEVGAGTHEVDDAATPVLPAAPVPTA